MTYSCKYLHQTSKQGEETEGLFLSQSPDMISPIASGSCVTHVFLTSGDAGLGLDYSESREAGNETAVASMAGVTDSWTEYNATLGGQLALVRTLAGQPNVQRVWLRLPDGNMDGTGFSRNGGQSLLKLYYGSINSISNRYGTATFSMVDLITALTQIIVARAPATIATLDYLSDYGIGDHTDHQTAARIVSSTVQSVLPNVLFKGYVST